jgi:hypothetical protein
MSAACYWAQWLGAWLTVLWALWGLMQLPRAFRGGAAAGLRYQALPHEGDDRVVASLVKLLA